MAELSDYSEALLLDYLMTAETVVRPTGWYLALYTSAPSDAGGGTEVSGNGYARQVLTCGAASSPGGNTTNTDAQNFTAAGGSWGTVTHIGIFDALTVGNLIWHGELASSRVVSDGDTLTFPIGNLGLTLS